uniref:Uncharacterized protein n=1 Tax=Anguilla anguilla TaxID=7936 RepID=A0A0E9RIH0_ANGAN
MLQCIITY